MADNIGKIDLNGSTVTVYHRTRDVSTPEAVCSVGFLAGPHGLYGSGIYSTYDLRSSYQSGNMRAYGGYVIKGQVDLNGFVIFDYPVAKEVYGSNYSLADQIKSIIGIDAIIDPSTDDETKQNHWQQIEGWSEDLEKEYYSSHIAQPFTSRYNLDKTGVKGIVYTGENDGKCVLTYRDLHVIPIEFAFIDGTTYKNPNWESCGDSTKEAIQKMQGAVQDEQILHSERRQLVGSIAALRLNDDPITLKSEDFPHIPEDIFDNAMINFLYEDESRIQRLSPESQEKYKEIIKVDFLIRKLKSAPTHYWEQWREVGDDVKKQIPEEILINIWDRYLQGNPGRWEDIPTEMKDIVPKDHEVKYWLKATRKNEENWQYVPKDIMAYIQQIRPQDIPATIEQTHTEDLGQTHEFDVPEQSMKWLEGKIKKLNARADKLGLPPLHVEVLDADRLSRSQKVRIIGNIPIIKGWQLLSKVMPTEDMETGKITNNVEHFTNDEKEQQAVESKVVTEYDSQNIRAICEDCREKRKRVLLYMLSNTESGELKCVGSSCLSDFVKSKDNSPNSIANYASKLNELLKEIRAGLGGDMDEMQLRKYYEKKGIPVALFLSKVMALENAHGFVSKTDSKRTGDASTPEIAYNMCVSRDSDEKYSEDAPISAGDLATVNQALEWISTVPPFDPDDPNNAQMNSRERSNAEFNWNIHNAVETGVVKKKTYSTAAWLPEKYKRMLQSKGIETQNEDLVGPEGSQVVFKGKLVEKKPILVKILQDNPKEHPQASMYNIAEDGQRQNTVTWLIDELDANMGQDVAIQGTVSGSFYTGQKFATVLTDVSVIDDQTYQDQIAATDKQMEDFINPPVLTWYLAKQHANGLPVVLTRTDDGNWQWQDESGQGGVYTNEDVAKQVESVRDDKGKPVSSEDPRQLFATLRPAPQAAAVAYNDGDTIENDFRVVSSTPSRYNQRYVLEDIQGNKVTAFMDDDSFSAGDDIRVGGIVQIDPKWGIGLKRARIIPPVAATPQVPQQAPQQIPQAPQDSQDADSTAGTNWFKCIKSAAYSCGKKMASFL